MLSSDYNILVLIMQDRTQKFPFTTVYSLLRSTGLLKSTTRIQKLYPIKIKVSMHAINKFIDFSVEMQCDVEHQRQHQLIVCGMIIFKLSMA
jgi:hypothetical protein